MFIVKNRIVLYKEGTFHLLIVPPTKKERYWRIIPFDSGSPKKARTPLIFALTKRQAIAPFIRLAQKFEFVVTKRDRAALKRWAIRG